MAKYSITMQCGHLAEFDIYGKAGAREDKKNVLAQQKCPDCLRIENMKLYKEDLSLGMCELEGSDKQIPWAASIRHNSWIQLQDWISTEQRRIPGVAIRKQLQPKDALAMYNTFIKNKAVLRESVYNISDASWWIDRRQGDMEYLSEELLRYNARPSSKKQQKQQVAQAIA